MKRADRVSNSAVAVSIKLVVKFIEIAIQKGYITEDQARDVISEMPLACGVKI